MFGWWKRKREERERIDREAQAFLRRYGDRAYDLALTGNASCDALRILLEDKGFSRRDDVCTEVIEVGERI